MSALADGLEAVLEELAEAEAAHLRGDLGRAAELLTLASNDLTVIARREWVAAGRPRVVRR